MKLFSVVTFFLLLFVAAAPAHAQQLEKTFNSWSVYSIHQNGKKVCYMFSSPKKKTGNYRKRSEPYALVTHVARSIEEVSVSSGYPYKSNSEVEANIDGRKSKMFTKDELAWAYDTPQDRAMITSMKKGNTLKVRGTSRRNTYSVDTYSLKGFTKAFTHMKQLCKS